MAKVRVPASTSNLGSGFDTFGLALQLYLTVEMSEGASPVQIEVSGEHGMSISRNHTNLIYRAAEIFYSRQNLPLPHLNIRIENDIPLARGLGSSGAAAVAGLLCAAELSGNTVSREELLHLATELEGHPENAAASLYGGVVITCMANRRPLVQAAPADPDLQVIAIIPETHISTEAARQVLPDEIGHKDAVFNVQRSALLAHALVCQNYQLLKVAMQDKLHQPYRKHLIPEFDSLQASAYDMGALGVCISGSGSTILAFARPEDAQRIRQQWQEVAAELGLPATTRVLAADTSGALVL